MKMLLGAATLFVVMLGLSTLVMAMPIAPAQDIIKPRVQMARVCTISCNEDHTFCTESCFPKTDQHDTKPMVRNYTPLQLAQTRCTTDCWPNGTHCVTSCR